jgi:hypothetical protein
MMVAPARFYTPGVRAVHKTEHLSAVFGSITPEIHTHLRHAGLARRSRHRLEVGAALCPGTATTFALETQLNQ